MLKFYNSVLMAGTFILGVQHYPEFNETLKSENRRIIKII